MREPFIPSNDDTYCTKEETYRDVPDIPTQGSPGEDPHPASRSSKNLPP